MSFAAGDTSVGSTPGWCVGRSGRSHSWRDVSHRRLESTRCVFRPVAELRRLRCTVLCVLVTLIAALHPVAVAQQADVGPPPLIVFASEAAADERASASAAELSSVMQAIRSDPLASDLRIGHSSSAAIAAALDTRVLSVAVPSTPETPGDAAEALIVFTGVDVEHNDENLVSLHARDEATDSEAALVIQGPDVLGSVRHGDEVYKFHPLGDGLTAVYRYDTSRLRRHPRGYGDFMLKNELMQRRAPAAPARDEAGASGAAADTGDVIDLLVAYTPEARRAAGNIDAFIQFAIDNTHRIYRNSNIGLRLRLVHKYQTSYTEHPSDMEVDLDRLTVTSDTIIRGERWDPEGHMDEVHELRDRYGADLVALIVARASGDACGIAWIPNFRRYPSTNLGALGFSVTAHECETITNHTFAHELGHNQGGSHDPDNVANPPPPFPYGQGRCNTAGGWHTTMAYSSNRQGSCWRQIEYFSSPILNWRGTPTGDAARRDNRRVLLETARRVANFRQSKAPQASTHTLALIPPASNSARPGFVRIINHSDRAGTVDIHAVDDTGRRFGPVELALEAMRTRHFNSVELENGNAAKGLATGVGDGTGNWRLELSSELSIEALAYIRTPDGFLTSMHEVAAEIEKGSNRYHVPFFNPGSNLSKESLLRLINPGGRDASVVITGVDDAGEGSPLGEVRLTLGAGAARMLSARELEQGGSGITGRLGDGTGKWRFLVSSNQPLLVMSLLQLPTGHVTNLSRGQQGVAVGTPPPPPSNGPDLVVQSPSVSNSNPSAGQSFTLNATVRNDGDGQSVATTLRYYRSSDATITATDTQVGTDAVGGLAASGTSSESVALTAPSTAGTSYYGACVDAVSGESNTTNNCSPGAQVTVRTPEPGWERSGTGPALFDLPTHIVRIRIIGEYHGSGENFVVWCGRSGDEGGLLVNVILGTSAFTDGTRYSGFHSARRRYNRGGEPCRELWIELSQGVRWTVTEVSASGATLPTADTGDEVTDRAAVERARAQVLRRRAPTPFFDAQGRRPATR